MRRTLLTTLGLLFLSTASFAANLSINDDGRSVESCDDLRITYDDRRVAVLSEDVPYGGGTVRIESGRQGGVYVIGGAARTSITACKAALVGDSRSIRVVENNGVIGGDAPDSARWILFFIVRTARGADVDVEASNGPISLRDVDGRVKARAQNGPISLRRSSGTLDVATVNGPISIHGGSGDVKAIASNGPITLELTEGSWIGNLEASTRNGPLSVRLPRNYGSGVLIETNGHSPISCDAHGCPEQLRDDEWPRGGRRARRIELGNGPANIHLSTQNGPLSIKERD